MNTLNTKEEKFNFRINCKIFLLKFHLPKITGLFVKIEF